ncbi:PolC-type DNA polymerase III [Clostridium sp.]|uniref:3'-5' exonuclease n=1 Tax=Clostridium TaxID=1485 RepID=UPI0035227D7D
MEKTDNSYIAIDLETTGLNPKTERIIEIGAARVEDGIVVQTYSTFVNPERELDARIRELTGICDDDLKDAPVLDTVLPDLLAFCGELPLLGHHVIFDFSFLKRAAVNRKYTFEHAGLDTLKICRHFMPEEEKKNLAAACRYFAVDPGESHRALSDAMAAHHLYQELKNRYFLEVPEVFAPQPLIYKVKREQPASKKQKEVLRELLKYHRINLSAQIDSLSKNEISRLTDQIIAQHGRMQKR